MRPEFETFLARLYTDAALRSRFLTAPRAEAERCGLTDEECAALERIDRAGLELAARSFPTSGCSRRPGGSRDRGGGTVVEAALALGRRSASCESGLESAD
jgi:hypothetical protein